MATYSKNTANVQLVQYGPHRDQYYRVYFPTGGPRANAPLIFRLHGGGNRQYGFELTARGNPDQNEVPASAVADEFVAAGWYFINCEFPIGQFGAHNFALPPGSYWHQVVAGAARAIQHAKDHATDPLIFGTGGSIDVGKIGIWGNSGGAHAALMIALSPSDEGLAPFERSYPLSRNPYGYHSDHSVRFVFNDEAILDFSQLDRTDPAGAGVLGAGAWFFRNGEYGGTDPFDVMGGLAEGLAEMQRASPWYRLVAQYPEHKNLAIYSNYAGDPGAGLALADWNPGVENTNFLDAHDTWQGQVLEELSKGGTGSVSTIPRINRPQDRHRWGTVSSNPTGLQALSGTTLGQDIVAWAAGIGI
ncbi:MAG: alpha/beta hydrolase [Planctomycetota bacterium]|jgi:acetyl esterase/lipase